jgi:sugar/nucleoside kinase (ribokinase family)
MLYKQQQTDEAQPIFKRTHQELAMNPNPSKPSSTTFDIVLAGETNLDLILYGLPDQMPVERELLGTGFEATLGGSSSILAHNLAMLGTRVGFISEVGDDDLGRIAQLHLSRSGVDLTHFRQKPGASSGVTILLPHGKERHILTYPGVMAEFTVEDLDFAYLTSARHFHLSSLFLQTGLHRGLPKLFDRLRAAGLTLSLDTNDDPSNEWGGVLDALLDRIDILLPNEDELLRIARCSTLEAALDKLSPRVPLIVVKCGKRGAVVQFGAQQGAQRHWVDPFLVEPVDTIGAGDSFNAGFLSSYLKDKDPLRAARFGNATGALSTLRPGGINAHTDTALRTSFLQTYR